MAEAELDLAVDRSVGDVTEVERRTAGAAGVADQRHHRGEEPQLALPVDGFEAKARCPYGVGEVVRAATQMDSPFRVAADGEPTHSWVIAACWITPIVGSPAISTPMETAQSADRRM